MSGAGRATMTRPLALCIGALCVGVWLWWLRRPVTVDQGFRDGPVEVGFG